MAKHSKIIYRSGETEQGLFEDTYRAFSYASQSAREKGTYVRSQSSVSRSLRVDPRVYRKMGATG